MKNLILVLAIIFGIFCLASAFRAEREVGPDGYSQDGYYYYDGSYEDYWYGPGYYWGVRFDDSPSYYTWRRRHWGGPYYWRYHHYYRHVPRR
ncbi:MAG TPA: hypothetical protein VLF94_07415 [Chlamydiales bacterium]|nr:hypothetical protein [Chlamydiales bacterium]